MRVRTVLTILVFLTGIPCGSAAKERSTGKGDLQATAKRFVELLTAGDFATAVKDFDETMKGALPAEKLAEVWRMINAQAGPFQKQIGIRTEKEPQLEVVFVKCQFEKAALEAKVVFDKAGKIAGLFFVPPPASQGYGIPDYVDPERFRETEVTVGAGTRALPGTLSVPVGAGPFPGVVLVHGSGPLDRDETVGPNKPFRDLAGGLASRGIAVLRYDKRTLVHAAEIAAMLDRLTLEEETVADALAAVRLLRASDRIDERRVFVLGHSLGGIALPRMPARDERIAGLVMMATPSRPLEDSILDQMSYLFSLDGMVTEEEQARLKEIRQQLADMSDPALAGRSDSGKLPLGLSRAYWQDMQQNGAPDVAAGLDRPLLILQGGRDYQVTAKDLAGWKKALDGRPNVEFRFYPKLNHLFMEGEGPGIPAEYESPGHVARAVIDDLAPWIMSRPPPAWPPRLSRRAGR